MGCGHSKDHPKNADLVKIKKKYDTEPIKKAKLVNIWVIGGDKEKSLKLAKLISERQNYLLVTEESLLLKEVEDETARGKIIKEILDDKGTICPGIVLDLTVEFISRRLDDDLKGVVFNGIPRDREQAWHLQKMVGPASLVIYCELKADALKEALSKEGEDVDVLKARVEHFQKSVLQLSKHKTTINIDGEAQPDTVLDECIEKINDLPKQ